MSAENPVSPKVVAATAGAGAGATLSTLLIWILGVTFWKQPATAAAVSDAIAAVPSPVSGLLLLLVTSSSAAVPAFKAADPLRVTPLEREQLRTMDQQKG